MKDPPVTCAPDADRSFGPRDVPRFTIGPNLMHGVLSAQSLDCGYRREAQRRPTVRGKGDKVVDRRALGVGCVEYLDPGPFEFREISQTPWYFFAAPEIFSKRTAQMTH